MKAVAALGGSICWACAFALSILGPLPMASWWYGESSQFCQDRMRTLLPFTKVEVQAK